MWRAPSLVEGRPVEVEAPPLATGFERAQLELPPRVPSFTRRDGFSLACASALHIALLAAFISPERRLGVGGSDPDAIGIEIVTVAPALEARQSARGRDKAAAAGALADADGEARAAVEETAARDSRREDEPSREEERPPPADMVFRDWRESNAAEQPAAEPVIAPALSDGDDRQRGEAVSAERALSPVVSAPASEVLARFRGGVAARGKEQAALPADAMAAARAGRRNAFQLEVYKAIVANQPMRIPGLRGEVVLHFRVTRAGAVGDVRVARSSGNRALDDAAVIAVRGARVPIPAADMDDAALFFQIPMTF